MTVSPIDLYSAAIRLAGQHRAQHTERRFDAALDGWHIMAFRAETDDDSHADYWEMHPGADEVVTCLTGAIRMYLRAEDAGDDEEIALAEGTAVIVPRGRWHRIEVDEPSDILAVTVLENTRLQARANA
ncbi:cupin domain-containing protein [Mycolicibacterium holsaticum]|uniref:cupin domain-containing protein n=1 Tax=Mycolicibacterium holsaticum TaxID=152142 RepID=UPI001C7D1DBA|nr:cupin domain-containing protein [Mycolicibacterium holsaticum]MDA4109148.1 cupin [Mycolicibacterium holsaticum DSM 44478 = JCM 12374]QZA15572.1 cupin domain-containing protein [Mycolicibacterium holsaticum DSM 44478 = JCM 12374]UNC10963.1 cupin domain-containing protein [Mycolicibacterium holsaticum DSM 44478 = JCM 12374]